METFVDMFYQLRLVSGASKFSAFNLLKICRNKSVGTINIHVQCLKQMFQGNSFIK